ncbi:hypothetical protein CALCODRAFT_365498 [Calocera cornea HHB12733]|uniref:Uncharacterized protein n=1 Tax=Calocera cornea HHB12733 TaxID=1353952 RepID=A0A165J9I3_9BASI|nr:hypothetical protein CALCODRAFT_365498 [Calocera cornea HHB12733]
MAGEKPLSERIAALQQRNTPPSSTARPSNEPPARRPGGQALKDRIARFEAAGGIPVPKAGASFGLAAPLTIDRKVSGGLIGNRIPSAGRYYVPRSRSASPTTDFDSIPSRSQTPEAPWQNAKLEQPIFVAGEETLPMSSPPLEPPFVLEDEDHRVADASERSDIRSPERRRTVPAILLSGPSALPPVLAVRAVNEPTQDEPNPPAETLSEPMQTPIATNPVPFAHTMQNLASVHDTAVEDSPTHEQLAPLTSTGVPIVSAPSISYGAGGEASLSSGTVREHSVSERPTQDPVMILTDCDGNLPDPHSSSTTRGDRRDDSKTSPGNQSISKSLSQDSSESMNRAESVPCQGAPLPVPNTTPPSRTLAAAKADEATFINQLPRERSASMEATRPLKCSHLGGRTVNVREESTLGSIVQRSSSVPSRKVTQSMITPKTRPSLNVPSLPSLFGDDDEDDNYVGGWASVITTSRH